MDIGRHIRSSVSHTSVALMQSRVGARAPVTQQWRQCGSRLVLTVMLLFSPVPFTGLEAQNPHRQGFWMEFGTGPSAIRMNCTGCGDVTRANGSGGFLRIGGTLSHRVLLGLETYGFTDQSFGFQDDDTRILAECGSLSAIVLWYPWRSHVFLKSGLGIAEGLFTVQPTSAQQVQAEGFGVGLTFGAGMDVPLSRRFAISLNAATFFTAIGDIELPNRRVDDVIPTTYMISIGLALR